VEREIGGYEKSLRNVAERVEMLGARLSEHERGCEKLREKAREIEFEKGTRELLLYYLNQPIIRNWSRDLPDDRDFNTYSVEIKIPALDLGHYMILASAKEDFSTEGNALHYSPLRISSISFITTDNWMKGRRSFYVTDRDTGRPLKGVKAQILESVWNSFRSRYEYKKRENYKTDKNGYFEVKSRKYRDYGIAFTYKNDELIYDDQYYQYPPHRHDEEPIQTLFFTDRAIYRPGQKIYFKGLMIKKKGSYGEN
jgi:hypothetical protein